MKRLVKVLLLIVACVICLLLLLSVVVPIVGKKYVVNHSKELIGREIHIDGIGLNLLSGRANIKGFELMEENTDSTFVSFSDLEIRIRLLDLLRNRVTIKGIHLTDADVNIWQQNSVFCFADIIDRFAPSDSIVNETDTDSVSSGMIITLNDIRLISCKIRYRDLTVGSDFGLNDVNLDIPALSFGGERSDGGVQLNFEQGGSLVTAFRYTMETSDIDVSLSLSEFMIDCILPYLKSYLNVGCITGNLNSNLLLRGNLNNPRSTDVTGFVAVDSFALKAIDKQDPLLSFNHFKIDLNQVALDSGFVHLNGVFLDSLFANVVIEKNGSVNLLSLMREDLGVDENEVKGNTSETDSVMQLRVVVDDISLSDLNLNFCDESLPDVFDYKIRDVKISSHNFSTDRTNSIDINGKVGSTGSLTCNWCGNVNALPDMKLALNISNVDLKEFSPYVRKMFAYNMTSGNISFISDNHIEKGYLNGINDLDIYKCDMEKDNSFKDAEFNLPMKTALYIITDKDDHIKMNLPVKGLVNSPEFSYKKILLKTFANLIVKISTAPFSALGSSLGLTDKDYSKMVFDGTADNFSGEQYQMFNDIADMINSKPQLRLAIIQHLNYSEEIEKTALSEFKKEYYKSVNNGLGDELGLLDIEKINGIPDDDSGFMQYADSVQKDGVGIKNKAVAKYGETAMVHIETLAQSRQSLIVNYLSQRKNIKTEQLTITTRPYDSSFDYNGDSYLEFCIECLDSTLKSVE